MALKLDANVQKQKCKKNFWQKVTQHTQDHDYVNANDAHEQTSYIHNNRFVSN